MRGLVMSVVLIGILAGIAFAKKEPKPYSEEGRVIATGTTEHTPTSGSIFGAPGGMTNGSVSSRSKYTRTYKVQTATKIFELDCGKEAVFHSTGAECLAGSKPIQVGDVLHFRIDKDYAYIPVLDQNGTQSGEEKLRILSAEAAEAKKETPPAPAPQVQQAAEGNVTKLSIASTPAGADIEVDGGFVGDTPSTVGLAAGDHTVKVSKSGFKDWERKIKSSGGNVNLNVDLEAVAK
jgi:PEGA domain